MKYVALLIVFSCLGHCSFSQFAFAYDPIEKRNQREINNIDALYHVSKQGDFQLMFWMLPGQQDRRTLLVLTNTNQEWHARYFERQHEHGNLAWKERPLSQKGVDTLWKNLQENDVLHLKSSEELEQFSFHPVENGVLYYFELMDKKGKRAYYFDCPRHQQQYNNHKELNRVINMIKLINNFIGENQQPVC